ncbi:MAG: alpha/beta hydrolase [Pseudomonadales bacterium]|nr:alpha/beta hydrolase [Pseudomonadales bacterium]
MDSVDDSRFRLIGSQLKSFVNVRKRSAEVLGESAPYLERGKGTPVVFLHGFSCNKSNWRGIMHRFPSESYRLIAPDLPGFCLARLDPEKNYSRRFFLDWINGFLDAIGEQKCHLVVHSTSAMIAIHYAAAHSERLHSLTLANMPDNLMPEASEEGGIVDEFFQSLNANSADELYKNMSKLFYKPPTVPKVLMEYNYNLFQSKLDDAENLFDSCLKLRPQLISKTPLIACSVLLITADHDIYAPRNFAEKMESNFRQLFSVELERCGHMSYLEKQTDFINALNEFVTMIDRKNISSFQCA